MAATLNARLGRLIASARAALAWERLWPAIAPMVGVAALFVATALMGLWSGQAPALKIAALAAFAVAFVAAGWRLRRLRMPDRDEALRRLEDDAALPHRPLGTYEDTLAATGDAVTESLWRVHRRRAAERLSALRYAVPRPDIVPHDPYGLRAAVGIVLFIGIAAGAGAFAERLLQPFDLRAPASVAAGEGFRLDAWVTPPAYTGRSPLFLSAATRVTTEDGIRVPAGSQLTVRSQGADDVTLTLSTPEGEGEAPEMAPLGADGGSEAAAGAFQGVVDITGAMTVTVRRGGAAIESWAFVADGDLPPTAEITEAPKADTRNGFELRYRLDDDYAIASGEALVTPHVDGTGRRPLVDNPSFALTLPGGPGMRGAARTVSDLSAHPYAGLEASVRLRATDGAGQTGLSEPRLFRIPARTFINPLARAVLEQRTTLALDANAQVSVIDAFDMLLLEPDALGGAGTFLAMKVAYRELVAANSDDELRVMLDRLWQLALMLEDDGMSDAERALQAAQERLRQALEDGASQEEIARLTQELREAMQRYMQALAERSQSMPQQSMSQDAQTITQKNLDDLLKRIEELAKAGRNEEAEALLAELQQMMQNLQMAQRGQGQQGDPMGQAGRTLDELGKMIQRQQELMDDTYGMNRGEDGREGRMGQEDRMGRFGEPGQNGRPRPGDPGQNGEGMSPQERADALRQLQEQQQALRQQLEDLMRQLEEQGFEPGERLDDAGRSMGDAGDSIGDGQTDRAVGEQGEALQALREGAQGMAQQLAEAQQGGAPGEGEDYGAPDQGPGRDPLGRTRREGSYADTSRVGVPEEFDTQRARQILQELRRRLGDLGLPRLERDYLERLLPQQ